MTTHDTPEADTVSMTVDPETGYSYCCECGTYDAHETRCLRCGFDFRAGSEASKS